MHYIKSKQILSNKGGVNLYRGCTHGCVYCDSRSNCYHMEGQFEDIAVKADALTILDRELAKKRHRIMVTTGSMCDPYMHIEKDLKLTQGLLKLVDKYNHGIHVLTKSSLVYRDIDCFEKINQKTKAFLAMTLTTIDDRLSKMIEPHVSTTTERLATLKLFKERGIEVGVWLCPILPFINDSEENILAITEECIKIGVKYILTFGNFGLTLRDGNREYYYQFLDCYFPGLKEEYRRIYGNSYEIASPNSLKIWPKFIELCENNNILYQTEEVFSYINKLAR